MKNALEAELIKMNHYIDKTETHTAITAPESSLGMVLSEQKPSDIKLKQCYLRKRKVMNLLDQLSQSRSFNCHTCTKPIEIERLILMPNAHFCEACLKIK